MLQLEREQAAAAAERREELATVEAALAAVAAEKAALADTHKFKGKVKLDVGGRRFTTSLATLVSQPGSLLAAMFSGRYAMHADGQEGSFFIDRDGRQFHHVLNFLRSPASFEPPGENTARAALGEDAAFFGLEELAARLRQCAQ